MRDLICINATPWTIAISATHAQVGCVNMSHEWWLAATDEDIGNKSRSSVPEIVNYRKKYGFLIKSLIATMKEKSNDQEN